MCFEAWAWRTSCVHLMVETAEMTTFPEGAKVIRVHGGGWPGHKWWLRHRLSEILLPQMSFDVSWTNINRKRAPADEDCGSRQQLCRWPDWLLWHYGEMKLLTEITAAAAAAAAGQEAKPDCSSVLVMVPCVGASEDICFQEFFSMLHFVVCGLFPQTQQSSHWDRDSSLQPEAKWSCGVVALKNFRL